LGGVAAALAASRLGRRVVLTEGTDWLGGQLTSQAVPPDEHAWIESTGCTASYRRLRENIRGYYRRNYPLLPRSRADERLDPGMGVVSRLCHEPRVALAAIEEMLAPHRAGRKLEVLLRHRPLEAESDGDLVRAVILLDERDDERTIVSAPYILDATELGELLPMAGVEHVIGAESHDQTGEPHAVEGEPDPLDQQAVSWCFPVDYLAGEDHTIEEPEGYRFWRSYRPAHWPGAQLGWEDVDPVTLRTRTRAIFDGPTDRERADDLWHFRRAFYRKHYPEGLYPSDVTLVNWPQIDYRLGPWSGFQRKRSGRTFAEPGS
jgi:hypothetical protein